ncbi:MAG: hypothetical protein CMM15_10945 [Rhodospirillaceae bacterium]|nr:hypothetical protein [Rhodospirillaceae bacterium]OUX67870.1 MAG: hypothetical protein CBD38_01200 [bacterium TMED178]
MIQIAHRGLSEYFKDNSKEAFNGAIQNGFEMIELDIQLSKDGIIFVYHDTFIDKFLLNDLTFQQISNLDKDILSFADFLSLVVKRSNIKIYLDMKGPGDEICQILHDMLQETLEIEYIGSHIYIGSFNIKQVKKLRKLSKDYNLGIITENRFPKEMIEWFISSYDLQFFSFHWTVLDDEISEYIHQKNIQIFTYTNKANNILNFMREKKYIDGIVTNYKFQ